MKKMISFLLVFLLTVSMFNVKASASITYEKSWGNEADSNTLFRSPVALAKDEI